MPLDRAKTLLNAEKQLKAGKLPEAIVEFKKLAEDNPRDMNIVNRLGDLCVRAGKNQDAFRYFLRIAEFYSDDGFYLKAIAMYKKVSKLDPSNMDCLQKLASLYHQQGLTIEARAQYMAIVEHFVKAGQVKKALEIYPSVLQVEPENMKARLGYADLLSRAGSPVDAGKEYRHVAQELATKGLLDEAIKVAQKGAKMLPGNADMMSFVLALSKEAKKSPGDMLASVVEMAKANGDNPRSLALLGEAYLCAGKTADAEKVFRRLIGLGEKAPPEVAAAVGRYHLSRQKPAEALQWLVRAAEAYAGSGRGEDALGLLAEFSRAFPEHREGHAKRAEIAEQLGDTKAQVESLVRVAELVAGTGNATEANEVLRRIQSLDPDNPAHAQRLAGVGKGAAAPAGAEPAAVRRQPDIQEGAFDLEPRAVPAADVEPLAAGEEAEEEEEEGEDKEAYGPDSRIQDLSAVDDQTGEPEDDEFISENLTEAEVFIKYGLLEKAKDQLQKILAKHPKHIPSHTRLKEIYYEEGDKDKAVAECLTLAGLLKGRGRAEDAQDFVNEAVRIDPNNPRVKQFAAGTTAAAAKPAPAAAAKPAPAAASPGPPQRSAPVPAPKPPPAQAAPPPAPQSVAKPRTAVTAAAPTARAPAVEPQRAGKGATKTPGPAKIPLDDEVPELKLDDADAPGLEIEAPQAEDDDLEIEIDMDDAASPAARPAPAPGRPAPAPGKPATPPATAAGKAPAAPAAAAPRTAPAAVPVSKGAPEKVEEETPEDAFEGMSLDGGKDEIRIDFGSGIPEGATNLLAVATDDPDQEKLGEVDFYIDQGLLEEARAVLFQLQKQYPRSTEVSKRFERANRPAAEPATPSRKAATGEPGMTLDVDIERAFATPAAAAPPAASKAVPRASKATPVFKVETSKTEAEGDFFDLAGELDRSLAEAQVAVDGHGDAVAEEGHSIDEIFRAFRKGVEQQVDAQDYETHYNLGIAYKEMGLVDEAIAEFQYAAKDPTRTVECCGILGLCFREKGMPQLALKWFQKGLDSPEIGDHESVGLRYDMAEVYREQGDFGRALDLYTEVYGLDSRYREVADRLKEVRKHVTS